MKMDTSIAITLDGTTCRGKEPTIQWQCDQTRHRQSIWKETTIEFSSPQTQGTHLIQFEFFNKTNEDTTADEDLAVIIKDIQVNGISDPKVNLVATYYPEYPEPWLSQQDPKPSSILPGHQYLGWNGIWRLEYDVPAFAWIHKIKGLGWQY
jgi:hypothetical protein